MGAQQELSIHVQNACTSDCSFCIVDATIYNQEIPREEIEGFLDDNEDHDWPYVNFHGGEPTMRNDFVEIVQSVTDREMGHTELSVQTNGRRLAKEAYTKSLVDAGVDLFVVSMHGHTAEIQDETSRRKGSFDQAVDGIKNARKLGCKVRTNSVVAKNNYQHLPEMIDFLASLDVNVINLSALHTASEAVKSVFLEIVPRYEDVRPYLVKAIERANHHGIPVVLEGFPACVYPENLDIHLFRPERKIKMYFRGFTIQDYDEMMDTVHRRYGSSCDDCALRSRCGGAYREYVDYYGWEEFETPERLGTWSHTHPEVTA